MPNPEIAYLREVYQQARVILEYGAGGTTRIAASLPGKFIISVESDSKWAHQLQQEIDSENPASPVVIYPVDIGPTSLWGRPVDTNSWRHFFRYPLDVWEEPFFRHPDTILIDGRMRTACLAMTMLRCTRPVKVLFDDYGVRPLYQAIEKVIKPTKMVGRLAQFDIEPNMVSKSNIPTLIKQFAFVSIHGGGEEFYHEETLPW